MSTAYKVTDYFTGGFYFYTPAAMGGKYKNVNYNVAGLTARDLLGSGLLLELAPVLAFKLPYNVNIALAYRINYMKMKMSMYDPTSFGTSTILYNDISLSGFGFKGLSLGVQYNPVEPLHIGATYCSFAKIDMTGTLRSLINDTTYSPTVNLSSLGKYADKFGIGVSYEFIKDKLLLAVDYDLYLYSSYNSNVIVMTETNATITVPINNKNAHEMHLGVEYKIISTIPLRDGFAYLSNFTN